MESVKSVCRSTDTRITYLFHSDPLPRTSDTRRQFSKQAAASAAALFSECNGKLERRKLTPFFRCFRSSPSPSLPSLRSFSVPNCLKGNPQVRFFAPRFVRSFVRQRWRQKRASLRHLAERHLYSNIQIAKKTEYVHGYRGYSRSGQTRRKSC